MTGFTLTYAVMRVCGGQPRKNPGAPVWQMIIKTVNVTNSSAFQKLQDESKRKVLKELKAKGASHRQLERLTGVGRGLIQKL